jgi:hypothetical protein
MTPKEKATNLVEKFDSTLTYLESKVKAKQLALVAVDEIIKALEIDAGNWIKWNETKKYWQEVKQEIQAL